MYVRNTYYVCVYVCMYVCIEHINNFYPASSHNTRSVNTPNYEINSYVLMMLLLI